jgi:mono/diheme cytochrome c family protein
MMRRIAGIALSLGTGLLLAGTHAAAATPAHAAPAEWGIFQRYCADCHNTVDWAGGIQLEANEPAAIGEDPGMWESVARKLRTGMMPPPGKPRPARAQIESLSRFLETRLDDSWKQHPMPGTKTLHRLNRNEYANAIRDLLRLDVDASTLLPADDAAEGFDNMADVLGVSPTLIQSYVSAAMKISRAAVGDPKMASVLARFSAPGGATRNGYIEGLPLGTRGGLRIVYNFPLDAEYEFRIAAGRGGGLNFGGGDMIPPKVDVTLNGTIVPTPDPRKFRIRVPAGPQTITVAMVDQVHGAGVDDLYALAPPRRDDVDNVTIQGPFDATGPGNTPARQEIFVCHPQGDAGAAPCARKILARLASAAFRVEITPDSPVTDQMLQFYVAGSGAGGFETGIQRALARILVDPRFLYRVEADRPDLAPGAQYRISDEELASRLSFFLWSSIPDARLRQLAQQKKLHEPRVLEQEVRRMLGDPRSAALTENFAGQWLHLRELDNAQPLDRGFDDGLKQSLMQETQMLFASVMHENRSIVDLLDNDYTFLNERLARHYGIEGVRGTYMRRVQLPKDSPRRGLLGQGSILTVTSVGNRTSPVMRGAWVLTTLLGATVPNPPPGVEADLKEGTDQNARPLSVRERLEKHRINPTCASCHSIMDPIGFALENFDLIGRWRDVDGGLPVNSRDEMSDGTKLNGVADLRRVLLSHTDEFLTSVSAKLLQYALGRRLEAYDQPAVRQIVLDSRREKHTVTALVQAVVKSAPFQMRVQNKPAKSPDIRQANR